MLTQSSLALAVVALKSVVLAGSFEDPAGVLLPQAAGPFLDTWKRTKTLVLNQPDVSMIVTPSQDGANMHIAAATRPAASSKILHIFRTIAKQCGSPDVIRTTLRQVNIPESSTRHSNLRRDKIFTKCSE